MLKIDFTDQEKPFGFIRNAMTGHSEEEIIEAHQSYCLYLNLLLKILHKNIDEVDES